VVEYPCFEEFLNTNGSQNTRSARTNEEDPGFEAGIKEKWLSGS